MGIKMENNPGGPAPESSPGGMAKMEISKEVREKLDKMTEALLGTYTFIADHWKEITGTGAALTFSALLNMASAKDGASLPQESIKDMTTKLENIKNVSGPEVLKYEDQLADYAKQYGERFEIKDANHQVHHGTKIALGDNIGVRFYYAPDDSTLNNPTGFALDMRKILPGNLQHDAIMVDGDVIFQDPSVGVHSGGGRDGKLDQVVAKVGTVVVGVYNYDFKKDATTGKTSVNVTGSVRNEAGKMIPFTLAGGDQNFVSSAEYLHYAAQLAANQINAETSKTASAETIPTVTF